MANVNFLLQTSTPPPGKQQNECDWGRGVFSQGLIMWFHLPMINIQDDHLNSSDMRSIFQAFLLTCWYVHIHAESLKRPIIISLPYDLVRLQKIFLFTKILSKCLSSFTRLRLFKFFINVCYRKQMITPFITSSFIVLLFKNLHFLNFFVLFKDDFEPS